MRVLLYSKADCSLCDAFHFELSDLQNELGFVYEQRHLQEGDSLLVQFDGRFPVVEILESEIVDADTADASNECIRLLSPITQRQLRAQIRQSVAASSLERVS
jgi:hypothetical protein